MRRIPVVLCLLAIALAAVMTPAQPKGGGGAAAAGAVLLPAAEIAWKELPEPKGGSNAALWTAPDKTAHDAFVRFPAGFVEGNDPRPVSEHPFGFKVVVLEGMLGVEVEGARKQLGPGSYAFLPPRMKHSVTCRPGADCVFFITYLAAR